ncbi:MULTISPECIES: cyclic nucleotide-binding domain-containing protein [Stenotrophomonas]|uniref:CRP-like protein Clp n=1 Tax=Stenotrophomonas aracearum TaxID=3003272 RepID=A0ABY9Y927_9GAMM|nr:MULTISPECIES: cyclic nucleotide-binding domain-containing protein [unclassified Stenotrophomonas]WNH47374.1 cyclic nucleotide-binding domain-containing protein [Stenotrophomonas sp. A5588]
MGTSFGAPSARCRECQSCPLVSDCFPGSLEAGNLHELDGLIEHTAPVHTGSFLFRQGDPFQYISVIRLGTVKTYSIDREGREQTLGFHMPGDILGLSAIDEERHPCNAIALDTVTTCRLPFRVAASLSARMPQLQAKLFRLLSRDIARATQLSCNNSADERLAAFLIGMADRMAARGYSASRWQLTMSRMDIASYLRLAPETLSRLLRRFQAEGLVALDGREVEVRGRERLQAMAAAEADLDQVRREAA